MREYTPVEIGALLWSLSEAVKRARQGEGVLRTMSPEHWKTSVESGQISVALDGVLPDGSPSSASRTWAPDEVDKVIAALQMAAKAAGGQCQVDDR
jgi:hypothetical protein